MNFTNILVRFLLHLMAAIYNRRPSKRAYLGGVDGWINFSIGVRTEDSKIESAIRFQDGTVTVMKKIPGDIDSILIFRDGASIMEAINLPPNEMVLFLIKGRLRIEGNFVYPNVFNYYISLLLHKKHKKMQEKLILEHQRLKLADSRKGGLKPALAEKKVREGMLKAPARDRGVKFLSDQYLPEYSLPDFPRLKKFLDLHFTTKPEICHERVRLMTGWFRENGFEKKQDGTDWPPVLRQAHAYKYMMENRKPVIRKDDLVAGTSTTKEIGVILYPDAVATMIWSELGNVADRELNSYAISEETRNVLHKEVFPFWTQRNFREWVRKEYGNPLCQRIDERFAVYFLWKTVALSHTIADFPKLLRIGTKGYIEEIRRELAKTPESDRDKRNLLEAMVLCIEGLTAYAKNLSEQAGRDAEAEQDLARKHELLRLAEICRKVPENPCGTLDEAVNAVWIGWVGLHMENTNAGLSLGRMDQWFQPYFEADMAKCSTRGGARRVHQARHRARRVLLHALHRPPAPDPRYRQLPLRRQLLRPGHHPGRRDARRGGRGLRHDLHLSESDRDALHPGPQCERALPPGEKQRHLSQAALRGEPDHHGHAVHAQRQGGHGVSGGIQLRYAETCATGRPPAAWSRPFRASTSATPTA